MPKKSLDGLTESMFYLLMAFCRQPMCGIDAAAFIEEKTGGRLRLGPATLYTILGKFEKVKYSYPKHGGRGPFAGAPASACGTDFR